MAFPTGWPARPVSGRRSLRFFKSGTTAQDFSDNAFLFIDDTGANPYTPLPYVRPGDGAAVVSIGTPTGTAEDVNDAVDGVQSVVKAHIWSGTIRIINDGATPLEFSFDGAEIHGIVLNGEELSYRNRHEGGISFRSGAYATGTITVVAKANLIDGEEFVLDDGVNTAITFEYDVAGDGVTPGDTAIDVSTLTTATEVRDATIAAIQAEIDAGNLNMTVVASAADELTLTNTLPGTRGNVAITETVADGGFAVTGMSGGTDTAVDFRVEAW